MAEAAELSEAEYFFILTYAVSFCRLKISNLCEPAPCNGLVQIEFLDQIHHQQAHFCQ